MKLTHVFPLPLAGLPTVPMPGEGGDLWMRGSHGSPACCLAISAVLLTLVQGSNGGTRAFALLADLQASLSLFSIVTFGLVKWPAP